MIAIASDMAVFFLGVSYQTRLARGASLRVSIGDIADLLELSPREIEELRKFHNDPKPKEVCIPCNTSLPSRFVCGAVVL